MQPRGHTEPILIKTIFHPTLTDLTHGGGDFRVLDIVKALVTCGGSLKLNDEVI